MGQRHERPGSHRRAFEEKRPADPPRGLEGLPGLTLGGVPQEPLNPVRRIRIDSSHRGDQLVGSAELTGTNEQRGCAFERIRGLGPAPHRPQHVAHFAPHHVVVRSKPRRGAVAGERIRESPFPGSATSRVELRLDASSPSAAEIVRSGRWRRAGRRMPGPRPRRCRSRRGIGATRACAGAARRRSPRDDRGAPPPMRRPAVRSRSACACVPGAGIAGAPAGEDDETVSMSVRTEADCGKGSPVPGSGFVGAATL